MTEPQESLVPAPKAQAPSPDDVARTGSINRILEHYSQYTLPSLPSGLRQGELLPNSAPSLNLPNINYYGDNGRGAYVVNPNNGSTDSRFLVENPQDLYSDPIEAKSIVAKISKSWQFRNGREFDVTGKPGIVRLTFKF